MELEKIKNITNIVVNVTIILFFTTMIIVFVSSYFDEKQRVVNEIEMHNLNIEKVNLEIEILKRK